jgi:hypothetical protein
MPSVYRDKKSPYYQTDIWIDGDKFSRSSRKTSRREAEAEADRLEQKLRDQLKVETATAVSLRVDDVALRYMTDIGDHHAGEGASITEGKVARLVKYFGPDKLMTDITHDDVVKLVNWRRGHRSVPVRTPGPFRRSLSTTRPNSSRNFLPTSRPGA